MIVGREMLGELVCVCFARDCLEHNRRVSENVSDDFVGEGGQTYKAEYFYLNLAIYSSLTDDEYVH